jgi:superfamily I DNA/RNA helicase
MKLVQNTHDSIALGRVVNSPPRGIGKTTMETLERMALTTGMSTWDAIGGRLKISCCRAGADWRWRASGG